MKPQNRISISILRRTILFFVLVLLHFSLAYAQEKKDIQIYFENDRVAVEKGSTFTNFLVIENKSPEEITIQNILPQEQYPGLLFYPKNDFTLGAGQSKNLPVKLIANVDFMKLKSNEIKFQVSYTSSTVTRTESASFSVDKDENKNIAIYTASYENFINPAAPDSSILLVVENQGYSKRSVKIDLQSIPDGLEMMPKQQTVSLEGLEKQTVEIKIAVRRQNTLFPEFNINAIATDLLTNEIVGSNTLHIVILSSNRQIARGNEAMSGSNFAEMSYNANSSGFNFLQLRGNTAFRVTENLKSRFNIGTDYYLEDGRYNIYDTCWNWKEKIRYSGWEMLIAVITTTRFSGEVGKFLPNLATIIRLKFLRWKIIIICTVLISNKQKDLPWQVLNMLLGIPNLSMGRYLIYSTMIRVLT